MASISWNRGVGLALTREALAASANISQVSIQRVERGQAVSPATAEALAKSLGLSLESSAVASDEREYQSVFISYGGPDEEFARLLLNGFVRRSIKVFFFAESAVPGQRLHRTMATAVLEYDRIVLVCSKASLDRPGILYEVEQVLAREATEGGQDLLIPLVVDDSLFVTWQPTRPDGDHRGDGRSSHR